MCREKMYLSTLCMCMSYGYSMAQCNHYYDEERDKKLQSMIWFGRIDSLPLADLQKAQMLINKAISRFDGKGRRI